MHTSNQERTTSLPVPEESSDQAMEPPELWVVCPATLGRYSESEDLAAYLGVDPGHVILVTGGDADGYEFEGVHLVFGGNPREAFLINAGLNVIHNHMRERGVLLWDVLVIDPELRITRDGADILRNTMRSLDTWLADPDDGSELGDRAHLRFEDVYDPVPHGPHAVMMSGETGIRFDEHIFDNDIAWQDLRRRARITGGSSLVNLAV